MLLQALNELLSGNFYWFVGITLNNLYWFFALFAFVVISNRENGLDSNPVRNPIRNFVFLALFLWSVSSLGSLLGLVFLSAGIFLFFQLALVIFWTDYLAKKHPSLMVVVLVSTFLLASTLMTLGAI